MSTGSLSPNRVNVSTSMSLESCSHDMCQYLSEGQTQADHTAHCSGMLLGALTPGIGIELGKHWQSLGTPMLYQGVQGGLGCDGSHGPSRHKPTMPRDTGEDLHLGPSCNDHTFDHINALELRVSVGDHGPIPAPWRWPTPLASASVEHPAASQDASNGPHGRERREAAGVNSRWIATAPNSPRSLCACNAWRTCNTRSSKDASVRRVRCGRDDGPRQSTRSRR
jgi:hypothetical protein